MATEDEEQQLYLAILEQPLDEFLEDLRNHNSEIKGKHRDALILINTKLMDNTSVTDLCPIYGAGYWTGLNFQAAHGICPV